MHSRPVTFWPNWFSHPYITEPCYSLYGCKSAAKTLNFQWVILDLCQSNWEQNVASWLLINIILLKIAILQHTCEHSILPWPPLLSFNLFYKLTQYLEFLIQIIFGNILLPNQGKKQLLRMYVSRGPFFSLEKIFKNNTEAFFCADTGCMHDCPALFQVCRTVIIY